MTDYAGNGLTSSSEFGGACSMVAGFLCAFHGINPTVPALPLIKPVGRSVYNGLQAKLAQNIQCPLRYNLFNFANFDLPGNTLNGLLTGAGGQINGTTSVEHSITRVGIGTGVYSLGAPRQIEFGLRLLADLKPQKSGSTTVVKTREPANY